MKKAKTRYLTSDRKVIRFSRRSPHGRVHCKQVVGCQLLTFPTSRCHDGWPMVLRNSVTLFPLTNIPMTLTNIDGEIGDRLPAIKKVVKCLHAPDVATDELSEQVRINDPMIKSLINRTISPMGRGRTAPKVINGICARTESARRSAGYPDPAEFAKLMGIKPDTWLRYESRTPLPHRYFERFVELTNADLNILLTGRAAQIRKAG